MNESAIVVLLKQKQGGRTQIELAKDIGVSPAYLSDVYRGNRKPAAKILRYLGIKKEVTYKKSHAKQ